MFEIFLLAFLSYRNGQRAKEKGQNVVAWAIYTVLAFLGGMMLGIFMVIFVFCRNDIDLNLFSSLDPKIRDAAQQQLLQVVGNNPLHMVTIEMFAIGGYLLVRALLDKKPGKKEPEVHWMDKLK